MPSFEDTGNHELLKRAYAATSPDESRKAYDEWAEKYDEDLKEQQYLAPSIIVEAVKAHGGRVDGPVLDAGCGTGLAGIALSQAGAKTIDGLDYSPKMLEIAKASGVYRDLSTGDLTKRLKAKDNTYDVVTCVGTLTKGHVGPEPALKEFIRVAKKGGGVVAVTILDDVYGPDGYKKEIESLCEDRGVELAQNEKVKIGGRDEVEIFSRIVVLKKK